MKNHKNKLSNRIVHVRIFHCCNLIPSLRQVTPALITILVIVSMLSSGCKIKQPYNKPSVPTAPTYKEVPDKFKEIDGWKVAEPNDAAIRGKWWEMYGDPELNALEEQVNVSNQNIALALATFNAERALVWEARSQYYPTVSTSPSLSVSHSGGRSGNGTITSTGGTGTGGGAGTGTGSANVSVSGNGGTATNFSFPIDAAWMPDLFGRVRLLVESDVYAAQASAADVENVRLTMQSDLAADYFQLRGQDAQKEVLDDAVVAYQQTLDLTIALFQTGIDSEEDVALARTQLATAKAQAIDVGVLRAQLEHAIAVLTGQTPSGFSIPIRPLTANPPAVPVGVPTQLLERRPDIAGAERRMASANANIGVARAAFYPALSLSGSAGIATNSVGSVFSAPSIFWSLGSVLTQTIFDGGFRKAQKAETIALYDETVATYRQTVLTSFQAVEDNLASLRILSQERIQQNLAIQASQRALELAMERYRLGIDSYLNVIAAQTFLYNNQRTQVTIQTNEMVSSVQLVLALGGGWDKSQLPSPKILTTKSTVNP